MQNTLITLFLFIAIFSYGQNNSVECEKNLQKHPYITQTDRYDPKDPKLQGDYKILAECGDLDSVDQVIFLGENLTLVVIEMDSYSKNITYQDLLNEIHHQQKDEYFISLRQEILDKMAEPDQKTQAITILKEEFGYHNLNQESYISKMESYDPDDPGLLTDYEVLTDSGKLDSIDQELFLGVNLFYILQSLDPHIKPVTYRDLLNEINKRKTRDSYIPRREGIAARMSMENKTVDVDHLSSDSITLLKTGFEPADITSLFSFLKDNKSKIWTYQEAVAAFSLYKEQSEKELAETFEFNELGDYETALGNAKKFDKKCLIYFSAYTSVNALKMEDRMFSDPYIVNLIKNHFVYYIAYTDSKIKTTDGLTTVGERNSKLQHDVFKSSALPLFYIVDRDGKIIAEQGYTLENSVFMKFLTK